MIRHQHALRCDEKRLQTHEMILTMTLFELGCFFPPTGFVCMRYLRVAPLLIALTSLGQRSDSDEWERMKRDCQRPLKHHLPSHTYTHRLE